MEVINDYMAMSSGVAKSTADSVYARYKTKLYGNGSQVQWYFEFENIKAIMMMLTAIYVGL